MDLNNSMTAVIDADPDLIAPNTFPPPPPRPAREVADSSRPEAAPPSPFPFSHLPPAIPAPALRPDSSRLAEFLSDPKLLNPLLDEYLEGQLKLSQLATAHHITVVDLLAILEHPDVVAIFNALTRHAALQADRIALLARPQAIERLADLASRDPECHTVLPPAVQARSRETLRKSAAHIERISKPKSRTMAGSSAGVPAPAPNPAEPTCPSAPPAAPGSADPRTPLFSGVPHTPHAGTLHAGTRLTPRGPLRAQEEPCKTAPCTRPCS